MTTLAPSLKRWLGAADSKAPDTLWETTDVIATDTAPLYSATTTTARTAVLTISGMPRALRPHIETAMVDCVPSESELAIPGADVLTANWFTPWRRCAGPGPGHYLACRQVITCSAEEFDHLHATLDHLAREERFSVDLVLVD